MMTISLAVLRLNLFVNTGIRETSPNIAGSVPAPKTAINTNPPTGLANVMHVVSAKKVSPHGRSPFKTPNMKTELYFLCCKKVEN